jgi:membrane protease YdiL (CAAX protease family)
VVGACLVVFAGGLFWLYVGYGAQIRAGTIPVIPAIVFQLALEGAAVIAILIGMPRLTKFSLRDIGFKPPSAEAVFIGLIGAVAMIVVVEGGASLIDTLLHQKHEQDVVQLFRQIRGQSSTLWFFAFFAIVLAPMMEETIFRTFFFNLGLRYGGFWTGALLSGLLFGAAHLDLYVLVPLMLGGMILSYVYYRSQNAFASMITHGLFNAATVVAIIFFPQLAK